MKKKSTSPLVRRSLGEGGSVNLHALTALLACTTAACLLVLGASLAFFRSEALAQPPQRTLTFEERVSYQRAIEDVYWRHRIWPKENSNPKPSLDAVMSQAQLEKKVADYLRKSQALEDYWQRPITAEQLQAEMDRMAQHTRQPEVLRDLFDALGNDPFVIAECLARPALAERLLTNWYAYDQRIHGDLRQRAETELHAHPTVEQMKQLSGNYSEIGFIKSQGAQEEEHHDRHGVALNSQEWDETLQRLAKTFNASGFGVQRSLAAFKGADTSAHSKNASTQACETIPIGKPSALQEDAEHHYVTAVIERTENRLKLATITWAKEPLESWLTRAENQLPSSTAVPNGSYTLPKMLDGSGCLNDTWGATSMNAPRGRFNPTSVWTGTEMIVWGGYENGSDTLFNTGGRYSPSTDTWTATSN